MVTWGSPISRKSRMALNFLKAWNHLKSVLGFIVAVFLCLQVQLTHLKRHTWIDGMKSLPCTNHRPPALLPTELSNRTPKVTWVRPIVGDTALVFIAEKKWCSISTYAWIPISDSYGSKSARKLAQANRTRIRRWASNVDPSKVMKVSEVVMGVPPKHPSLGFSMKPSSDKGTPRG